MQYQHGSGTVHNFFVLAALLTGLLLAGCDFVGGVARQAKLDELPHRACIAQTLERNPGVTNVKYLHIGGANRHDEFKYDMEGVTVQIGIWNDSDGITYVHWYEIFNGVPSRALIQRLRPKMIRIDSALEADCHIENLVDHIEESCPKGPFRGAECEPLPPVEGAQTRLIP